MNVLKNTLQVNQNRSMELGGISSLSAPVNSISRPQSLSVHDLRSLDGTHMSTEMDLSGIRRARYRARKNRRLDDSVLRPPITDQQFLKNSSSESVTEGNQLTVNSNSGVSSTHGSMECLDGSTRKPPEPLQSFLLKSRKRPLKGWHERFFSLSNGCLSYAKNQSSLTRGRNRTQIDLANTYVTSEPNKLKIDIDATAVVYHLKFEEATKFRQWLTAIKEHRSYDQYQSAINSSGRVTTNPTVSITVANAPPPDPSNIVQTPTRPNNITLYNASLGSQHKLAKSTNKLSNEHIATMEKLAAKLENAYQEVEKAKTIILTNIPENDSTEGDNSSPTQSVFFSPVSFSSFEGRTSSTVTAHRRFSSISSTTSMCTAVQGPATEVIEAKCTKSSHGIVDSTALTFVQAVIKFSDEAKRYIEEANEALATIQQMSQLYNNGLTPNRERKQSHLINTSRPRPRSLNERVETDTDSEGSSGEKSGDSQSDDIPILSEAKMNAPDMKGVILRNPEPVAGRRTTLPARQSSPPTFSLLALLRSNIGRDLTKLRLPAILNEPLSVLQNLCEELEYSYLLDAVVDMKDRIQRMLYVSTFAISGYTYTATRTATKSFTPLLGETFECIRPEKQWRFMAEQVSNSPPVAVAHCESKLWTYDQEFGIKYKFWGKTLEINATGGCQLYLPRWRETYTWNKVTTLVTNLVSPTGRTLDHTGDMIVECSNGVTSSIHFRKSDNRRQEVYRSVYGIIKPPLGSPESQRLLYGRWDQILVSPDENNEDRCIWRANPLPSNAHCYYGFTRFAIELNEPPPPDAVSSGHLPITDTRLRSDIRLLELGRVEDAEADNKRLEDEQRRRLKLHTSRDGDASNAWKPFWFNQKPKLPNVEKRGSSFEFNSAYWRYRESGGFKDLKLPILW